MRDGGSSTDSSSRLLGPYDEEKVEPRSREAERSARSISLVSQIDTAVVFTRGEMVDGRNGHRGEATARRATTGSDRAGPGG